MWQNSVYYAFQLSATDTPAAAVLPIEPLQVYCHLKMEESTSDCSSADLTHLDTE